MAVATRIVCLAGGEIIAAGPPEAVRHDPRVLEVYLGPHVDG
jgi:ABC-type branched-subunit amino acid transport system ATPase component